MATSELRTGQKLKNSLFFSLLPGNLGVETGSTWTASATNLTHTDQRFRYTAQLGLYEWDIYRDSYVLRTSQSLRHWNYLGRCRADVSRNQEACRGHASGRYCIINATL